MTWREVSRMSEKQYFVDEAEQKKRSFSDLCKTYGIHRSTGYKWLNRHQRAGKSGLQELSRQPKHSPNKTKEKIEALILQVRDAHPKWGGVTIKSYIERAGIEMPTEKTINRILKRHGKITIEESLKRQGCIRFEHEKPNELWQMDFKGYFKLANGKSCHPLTLLDDHSRFVLAIKSCAHETHDTVKTALIEVFREYGLPERMTMDNGPPWGYSGSQNYTRLSVWLIKQGIKVSHSRPYHPQTQGKLERFHRTMKEELLQAYYFDNYEHAQKGFDWFRDMYNYERPHQGIEAYSPGYIYERSNKEYREELLPFIYDEGLEIRKVNVKGYMNYEGKRYYVGEAFACEEIGLKKSTEDEMLDVYFYQEKVLKLCSKEAG